ncbi:MAG: DUF805 domain-containing protein [Paracoccaceae bacterium]|nr:DUF805 domain-containing protein [Paracoccaceae bacterium]
MTFQDAIRICFSKYIEISGRAQRAEFWWWVLFILAGNLLFSFVDGALFGTGDGSIRGLGGLFGLATLLPSICVAGRRLHDRDMSAWWLLLWLIPLVGWLIILIICALEGTKGANRFGPDPLGDVATPTVAGAGGDGPS